MSQKYKKTTLLGLVVVASFMVGSFASAGSIILTPATRTVVQGQVFTLPVVVQPAGATVYTVKASVTYPANLLEVRSFNFGSGWLPLAQPGYDTINNTSGMLVKTAGFTGGVAAKRTLGTITFRAKAMGVATIQVAGDSMLLNADNGNAYTSGNVSTVTINKFVPTVGASPAAGATVSPVVSPEESPSSSPSPSEDLEPAAIGGILDGGWKSILALAGVLLVAWGVIRWFTRKAE